MLKTSLQDANEYLSRAEHQYKVGDDRVAETNAHMATAFLLLDISFRLMEIAAYLEEINGKLGQGDAK